MTSFGQPLSNLFNGYLVSDDLHHQIKSLLSRAIKPVTVYVQQEIHALPSDSLVSIYEGVISNERFQKGSAFLKNRRVEILSPEGGVGPRQRRSQKSLIPHAETPAGFFNDPTVNPKNLTVSKTVTLHTRGRLAAAILPDVSGVDDAGQWRHPPCAGSRG